MRLRHCWTRSDWPCSTRLRARSLARARSAGRMPLRLPRVARRRREGRSSTWAGSCVRPVHHTGGHVMALTIAKGQVWRSRDTGSRWRVVRIIGAGEPDLVDITVEALDGGKFDGGPSFYVFPAAMFVDMDLVDG